MGVEYEELDLAGFRYLPDQGRWSPGIINNYELYISKNGKNWGKPVSQGEFSNIRNSPVWQTKEFQATKGRYVKFRAITMGASKKLDEERCLI